MFGILESATRVLRPLTAIGRSLERVLRWRLPGCSRGAVELNRLVIMRGRCEQPEEMTLVTQCLRLVTESQCRRRVIG